MQDHCDAVAPLVALLQELGEVVQHLSSRQYVQKPVGVVESSIGGHVRHCLDHVSALISAIDLGTLDYEHRLRGTPIETSRIAAIEAIDDLIAHLQSLGEIDLDQLLYMRALMCASGPAMTVRTSVGRELAYVLAHTIHHNALIGAMVKTLGGWLPERFGYAPSTVRHLEAKAVTLEAACAR